MFLLKIPYIYQAYLSSLKLVIAGVAAFVTLKDHKDNLHFNPTCRLINPSKNEPEKVSKQIVEKIISDIIEKLL